MYILPPKEFNKINNFFSNKKNLSSEQIFSEIKNDVEWINISYGEVLIFNQNLPHGNIVNVEGETRWSMNCRFKSIFSPYGDKKIGEFFEPITLRTISKIGMNYKFPNET
jgi:sporadic carbohydrate cluster 2OG-Fe(II) oxygenase